MAGRVFSSKGGRRARRLKKREPAVPAYRIVFSFLAAAVLFMAVPGKIYGAPPGEFVVEPPGRGHSNAAVVNFAAALDRQLQAWQGEGAARAPAADESRQGEAADLAYDYLRLIVPAQTLIAFRRGEPVRAYPVAIGTAVDPTPTGSFEIINRVVDPTWYPSRGGEPVPPGPDNPLGSRWLGIDSPGYGLHGTNNPASIGGRASLGCVRLFPRHVEELFQRVEVGVPVDIVYDRLLVQPHPDGEGLLLGLFPDPYERSPLTVDLLNDALQQWQPAGWPEGSLQPWLDRADHGPLLVWLAPERYAATTLNGKPLPAARPILIAGEPWLPVRALAGALGATVQKPADHGAEANSSQGADADGLEAQLLVDGRPVPVQLRQGRYFAPARQLTEALNGELTALHNNDRRLLAAITAVGVFTQPDAAAAAEKADEEGQAGADPPPAPVLLTRRAVLLAPGLVAVKAEALKEHLGADLRWSPADPAAPVYYRDRPLSSALHPDDETAVYVVLDEWAAKAGLHHLQHPRREAVAALIPQ